MAHPVPLSATHPIQAEIQNLKTAAENLEAMLTDLNSALSGVMAAKPEPKNRVEAPFPPAETNSEIGLTIRGIRLTILGMQDRVSDLRRDLEL